MTELDELFREAVAAPPPSRLDAATVLGVADRRRHRRTAAVAGLSVLIGGLAVVGGVSLGGRDPARPPVGASPPGSLIWAGRADADHLYRINYTCGPNPRVPASVTATGDPVPTVDCNQLWASADGGATWTARDRSAAQELTIVGPTTLLRYWSDGPTPGAGSSAPPLQVSTDAGVSWRGLSPAGPAITAVPPGGAVYASGPATQLLVYDPAGNRLRPLAHGSDLVQTSGNVGISLGGTTTTLWQGGEDRDGRIAVAVSHNGGATWVDAPLPGVAAVAGQPPYVYGLVTRDATTAYAAVSDDGVAVHRPTPAIPGTENLGWFRVFKTVDGGQTWQSLDSGAVMPAYGQAWVTADARLVESLVDRSVAGAVDPSAAPTLGAGDAWFAVSADGRTFQAATPPGLPAGLLYVDGSVAYSTNAVYVSDDGWNWREAWHE